MKKADKEALTVAINAAILALDDWTHAFAPDFCDEARVEEAKSRLTENGTLWYIATTVDRLRKAKELLK